MDRSHGNKVQESGDLPQNMIAHSCGGYEERVDALYNSCIKDGEIKEEV